MASIPNVDIESTLAHRSRRIMANVASFYDGPADKPAREDWTAKFAAALDQEDCAAYVNFLAEEGEVRVRAAYPGAASFS
ncbi:MAG TPA: hypothetical protein VK595_03850 [Vicinamibacterales bacterium]|nr:hypothetical protein [Vicinamibacterales bacterium]